MDRLSADALEGFIHAAAAWRKDNEESANQQKQKRGKPNG